MPLSYPAIFPLRVYDARHMYISYALFILYGPENVPVCDLSEKLYQSELEKIVALRGLLF